jgi:Tfp pilus assembly protein PilF
MSRTLNLVARLLARARKLHRLGAYGEAFRILTQLSGLRELPPRVAREVQARLAHLQLKHRNFARARRHLAALLTYDPANVTYHRLMARAVLAGRDPDVGRALEHLRRAARLAPADALRLSSFGWLAVRHGREEEGLRALRRAAVLAPDDPRVLGRLVRGLCQVEQVDEGRAVVRAALFRNPRDPRFRQLWADFQFEQLHRRQRRARQRAAAAAGGTALLPFAAPAPRLAIVDETNVRLDGPSSLPAPHLPRPTRKHAQ